MAVTHKTMSKIVRDELAIIARGLRKGRYVHTDPWGCSYKTGDSVKNGFNMGVWERHVLCGTVGCIGGWLDMKLRKKYGRGLASFAPKARRVLENTDLFTPPNYGSSDYTPARCAKAIENVLATGNPKWKEVMKDTSLGYHWNW